MVNVTVSGGKLSQKEIERYIEHVRSKTHGATLDRLDILVDGKFVELMWHCTPQKFERIRRITGYLVGDMQRWNDAKTAEEKERVKHL